MVNRYIKPEIVILEHPSLEKIRKGTVSKILSKSDVKPYKISSYLEKKDADFDIKMTQILYVYKEVELYKANNDQEHMVAILAYDEKPGIQAIENIAPDLASRPEIYPNWGRDYEYKRHGMVSLLASIDLLNGKIFGQIHDRHRSKEFVGFLKQSLIDLNLFLLQLMHRGLI